MKYQVIYESRTGNTKDVAEAIMDILPPGTAELADINFMSPARDADVYCIGFGVRNSTCPMKLLEFLELLNGKTILLFATCGMNPTQAYHDVLERSIEPFLPEECNYRGLYLCQGAISEEGVQALKKRMDDHMDAETSRQFEEFCMRGQTHPDNDDLEAAKDFAEKALDLW